jgi:hypothetical protein
MTPEENKAVVSRYFEEFHDGREHAILEEIMTPDLLEGTRHVTELLLTARCRDSEPMRTWQHDECLLRRP